MTKVAILDYGMGNLHSAGKALAAVGAEVTITNDPKLIQSCDKILFPGVGAMRDCMIGMQDAGIDEVIKHVVFNKPVMAICVGMQALFDRSAENGGVDCLGILRGEVSKFQEDWTDQNNERIKVPHMGWNTLTGINTAHHLWHGIAEGTHFYFVHSYYCQPVDKIVAGECEYGTNFCASILKDNLFATQFHPEKSHTAGLQLLKNFVEWKI